MTDLKFICHQLISVLAVSLTKILMKKNAVADSKTPIYSINKKEDQPCKILSLDDQHCDSEKKDEGHTNTTNISGETFSLSSRTEVEETEH